MPTFSQEVILVLIRTSTIFAFVALAACLSGCATNSALTLMEASKHTEPILPAPDVIERELKWRAFNIRKVYLDSEARVQTIESYPEHFFISCKKVGHR